MNHSQSHWQLFQFGSRHNLLSRDPRWITRAANFRTGYYRRFHGDPTRLSPLDIDSRGSRCLRRRGGRATSTLDIESRFWIARINLSGAGCAKAGPEKRWVKVAWARESLRSNGTSSVQDQEYMKKNRVGKGHVLKKTKDSVVRGAECPERFQLNLYSALRVSSGRKSLHERKPEDVLLNCYKKSMIFWRSCS